MSAGEKIAFAYVIKMLATTASVTSFLPPSFCSTLRLFICEPSLSIDRFNAILNEMRRVAPELRDLVGESMLHNNNTLPDDIKLLIMHIINQSQSIESNEPEPAIPQLGTYNPAVYGHAYYFNKKGLKLRNMRKFTIDNDNSSKKNVDHDDPTLDFERCQKLYSKVHTSAPGTSNLFL
ncbi:hypothetical protein DPMN_154313 [Dreissena polymorpha]|uniref:Uncharacterized protein n=1 Tax=Dreissena polymorpha TaxID=45954 RepID=A0A9D4J6V3_DREPO|nr:hypothetical protein DPMN_154313 [Dreissena polymorpha]